MMTMKKALVAAAALCFGVAALAQQEAAIRKTLTERLPMMGKIDEVTKSPVPGLYEVRVGTDLSYTDAEGNYVIHGQIVDARQKKNITEERLAKLTAIGFDDLPLKDAFTIVRGNGKRKMALFEDPNCGYCKRFERDLQKVDNVTVYMFLYPILGPDSTEKSRAVWCASDKGRVRSLRKQLEDTLDILEHDRNETPRGAFRIAATSAVTGWQFTPTLLNGTPVPVRMSVTVNFQPQQQ